VAKSKTLIRKANNRDMPLQLYAVAVICRFGYIDCMEAKMFDLLADATRRKILDALRVQDRSVSELVSLLEMSQPAVSKQLRILRESGLATVQVDAQRRIYRLSPARLLELDKWLAPYRAFWEDRLDDMEKTLDSMEE